MHGVIRPQLWIHWCVAAMCLACWAGLLYVGDLAEQADFGLRSILGIRSGRLANFFSTIMLLWSGQLALLIYWYRRKSRNDFHGRYRLWLWVGVALQFFLAVVATEAHLPFGEYMLRVWPLNVPKYELLSWLVPVSTISLAMFRLLGTELRNCACSRSLLRVAAVSGLVAAATLTLGEALPERMGNLLQVGSATLAHLGLATALLFHARYVIHVSIEAPAIARRDSLVKRLWRGIGNAWRPVRRGLKLPQWNRWRWTARQSSRPVEEISSPRPPAPARAKKVVTPSEPKAVRPQQTAIKPAEVPSITASKPAVDQKMRIDPAENLKGPRVSPEPLSPTIDGDDVDMKQSQAVSGGLNKKERRRLRKLQQSGAQQDD
ncbi:MAG: hypothetical protein KF861_03990 [Planctomycetaceae bacterium]|nr:hypothetical protein [Planctomycetaceae bacterium]